MKTILSDDKSTIILPDGDTDEYMTLEEFDSAYNEGILAPIPDKHIRKKKCSPLGQTIRYWALFRALVKAYGDLAWAEKTSASYADVAFVRDIINEKIGDDAAQKLDIAIKKRRSKVNVLTRRLSLQSKRVCLPFSESDEKLLQSNLYLADFRSRTLYRINKYAGKGILLSVSEVINEVQRSFKR